MRPNSITIIISLLLAAFWLPTHAQSVKDITGDQTGQYIYAQARDEDYQSALGLATDELTSRVEAYIGSNKMKKYNRNWKEWIKRIINEKYGRTRVFLYLSVNDLKPEAEALTAPKQDYVGGSSVEETKKAADKSSKVAETKKEEAKKEATQKAADKSSKVEETKKAADKSSKVEETKKAADKSSKEKKKKEGKKKKEATVSEVVEVVETVAAEETIAPEENVAEASAANPMPNGLLGDVISRIISGGVNGDIVSELSRGKNMKVVSMYGDNGSKYIPHAYIITNDNGNIRVYTPQDKEGTRTDLTDGSTATTTSGKMMYWFLKK